METAKCALAMGYVNMGENQDACASMDMKGGSVTIVRPGSSGGMKTVFQDRSSWFRTISGS